MGIEFNLNKENESFKYAENCETEHGWNKDGLTIYGEMCRIEGMIEIARANGLENVKQFWEERLKEIIKLTH